mgnify:CR=1 FL=1
MLKKRFTKALVAVGCAAVFALAALLGVFYHPDQMLSDGLYQSPKALDGNIFVVGIDDRAIDDIGPYQTWGRDVIAMAIEALNADALPIYGAGARRLARRGRRGVRQRRRCLRRQLRH